MDTSDPVLNEMINNSDVLKFKNLFWFRDDLYDLTSTVQKMSIILMTCQLSDLAYPLLACVSSSCARTNLYDPADPYDTELNIMGCHASDLAPLNIRYMGTIRGQLGLTTWVSCISPPTPPLLCWHFPTMLNANSTNHYEMYLAVKICISIEYHRFSLTV